jgi:hypothetical protein
MGWKQECPKIGHPYLMPFSLKSTRIQTLTGVLEDSLLRHHLASLRLPRGAAPLVDNH